MMQRTKRGGLGRSKDLAAKKRRVSKTVKVKGKREPLEL